MRVAILFVAAALSMAADQKPKPAPAKPAPPAAPAPFENPYSADELRNKQAVIETAAGTIVLDLLADRAPIHVAHFIKTARDGGYDGTLFHRVIKHGIIQGGDPLSKDPAAVDRYGTGGLNRLKPELNEEKHTRGAVSAVLVPNKPDSAGTQFFICIADQPALDGQYTVFARVAEGILVAQKISEAAVNDKGAPADRIAMTKVTIRDKPAPAPVPFTTETVAELATYRAVLETSMGDITISFTPDKAPEHVRNFLRLAGAGVYDGTSWHRVVKGFVVQTGHMPTRREPLNESQQRYVQRPQGGVQRSDPRARHRVDGSAGRAGHGQHVVLHRHRARGDARSEVHGLRSCGQRHRRRAEDRSGGGERRDASRADRAAARTNRRAVMALARGSCYVPSSSGNRGTGSGSGRRVFVTTSVFSRFCTLTPSSRTGRRPASVLCEQGPRASGDRRLHRASGGASL